MRSALRILGSSLVYALIATIVVSWGCAWIAQQSWRFGGDVVAADSEDEVDGDPSRTAGVAWLTLFEADFVLTNRSENVFRTGIPMIIAPERIDEVRWLPNVWSLHEPLPTGFNDEAGTAIMVGVPMRAMVGIDVKREMLGTPTTEYVSTWALPVGSSVYGRVILPLRPIWPGFAVNVIALAAVIVALRCAVRSFRNARRRAAGLCVSCAHPLDFDQTTCPECGITR